MTSKINYTLKVLNVIKETSDCVTICFKQPALKKIKYRSGQYLTVIFNINGRRYIRPYSFSSAPGIDETINITVKRFPGGIVSNHIVDKVKSGDMLEVMEPMGKFTLPELQSIAEKSIYLWATGSGITPLISLAKELLNSRLSRHVYLIYGNRNFQSVIFLNMINELLSNYSDSFSVYHFHTEIFVDEKNPFLIQGRINAENTLSILKADNDLIGSYHYVCGQPGLKKNIKEIVLKKGVSIENFYSEDFELIKDAAEFENINTRNIQLIINQTTFDVEVIKGKSILEAVLDSLIEMPYACQTGSCLLCRGKLIEGETKTIGIIKLPEELASNERLLCCSVPLTNNVKFAI